MSRLWLVCALLAGLPLLAPDTAVAQTIDAASGYVTGAPMPGWLGLATTVGRDAIQLADGCTGVVPGVNVIEIAGDELAIVDLLLGLQAERCLIVSKQHMSDVPCATNPLGACDVAYS